MTIKEISSTKNELVKLVYALGEKSKERKEKKLFVVEGKRELTLAIKGGYKVDKIMFFDNIITENEIVGMFKGKELPEVIKISRDVYQKLAYRESTEGIIAVLKAKNNSIDTVSFKEKNPLVLVMEATEKPGNIGAMLRTADAAGLSAVFVADPKTDLYNPNIIRSSVGCLFTNNVYAGTSSEIIEVLKKNNIEIYCASLQASKPYYDTDFTKSSAIVVGTEDVGLSQIWMENSTQNIIIPMSGTIDSINVSVSAAVLTFEAVRQRNAKK